MDGVITKMATDRNNKQEEEIDLLKLLGVLWKKAWIILLCAIIGGSACFYWTYRKVYTSYRSSGMLYVNNSAVSLGSAKLSISSGDIKAVNNLMDTYSVILTSRTTLEEIKQETGLAYSIEELRDMIETETVGETAIFKVSVTTSDPELSAHVANSILEVLPTKIATVVEGSSVQIVDYAVSGEPVVNGNPIKSAIIGALIGIVLSSGIIIVVDMLDNKLRDEEFLIETYKDIPVLASVPDLNTASGGGYYSRAETKVDRTEKIKVSNTADKVRTLQTTQTSQSSQATTSSPFVASQPQPSNRRPGNEGK